MAGCVLLALDSPGIDEQTAFYLAKIDIAMTVIFTIEMVWDGRRPRGWEVWELEKAIEWI